jgi:hypothetical protein
LGSLECFFSYTLLGEFGLMPYPNITQLISLIFPRACTIVTVSSPSNARIYSNSISPSGNVRNNK